MPRAIVILKALPQNDVEVLNALSIAYAEAGQYAEARQTITRLLALDPTNGLAYQNLAFAALQEAHATHRAASESEAEQAARRAIDLDPALAGAYTTLGVVLSETGR